MLPRWLPLAFLARKRSQPSFETLTQHYSTFVISGFSRHGSLGSRPGASSSSDPSGGEAALLSACSAPAASGLLDGAAQPPRGWLAWPFTACAWLKGLLAATSTAETCIEVLAGGGPSGAADGTPVGAPSMVLKGVAAWRYSAGPDQGLQVVRVWVRPRNSGLGDLQGHGWVAVRWQLLAKRREPYNGRVKIPIGAPTPGRRVWAAAAPLAPRCRRRHQGEAIAPSGYHVDFFRFSHHAPAGPPLLALHLARSTSAFLRLRCSRPCRLRA